MNTFFPRSASKLTVWLTTFSTQIKSVGPTLGLAATEVTDVLKSVQDLIDAIHLADQKKNDWRAAVKTIATKRKATTALLSNTIARIKTAPAWTPALGQTLGVMAVNPAAFALDSYKPVLRVQKTAERIELRFTRAKLDGVNIYTRKKGEAAWKYLNRVRYSPAIDASPPSMPGMPEVREYRAMGISKDLEVGQPSDIVSATVGD